MNSFLCLATLFVVVWSLGWIMVPLLGFWWVLIAFAIGFVWLALWDKYIGEI